MSPYRESTVPTQESGHFDETSYTYIPHSPYYRQPAIASRLPEVDSCNSTVLSREENRTVPTSTEDSHPLTGSAHPAPSRSDGILLRAVQKILLPFWLGWQLLPGLTTCQEVALLVVIVMSTVSTLGVFVFLAYARRFLLALAADLISQGRIQLMGEFTSPAINLSFSLDTILSFVNDTGVV
eukprot:scpid84559/ scgid33251/ 